MSDWSGRVALVTGAASGMGAELAAAMTRRGATVISTDINADALARAQQTSGATELHPLDVRDAAAFRALVDDIVARHGRIDYLFNNAGVGVGGEIQYLRIAHWDRIIDVNIRGTVNGVAAVYPHMLRQRSGAIINTSSLAGISPVGLLTPYAMTKHAVIGLTRSLRIEAEPYGVQVMALCPATIDTPMLDASNPADIASVDGHWRPDIRRLLTRLTGPAYPPDKLADRALRQVERNRGFIFVPAFARVAWTANRWFPWAVEWAVRRAIRAERRAAGR